MAYKNPYPNGVHNPSIFDPASRVSQEETRRRVLALFENPDPTRLLATYNQFQGILARVSFAEFCKQAWHVVEPSTPLEWNWHHALICDVLQAMFLAWRDSKTQAGRHSSRKQFNESVRNAVFNVPPGSLKSRLIAVCFPVWCWLHEPGMKFICLSVNEDATLRDGRMSRDLIRSEWYQSTFTPSWSLKADQDAISNYGNSAGGERLSKPSGSEIVGLRGDCLLIDDPNNPKEAENKTERDKINDLWDTNIYNRVNDSRRSLRIGVQQRTHESDWTGHVIKNQGVWSPDNLYGWLHVVLPAEFEAERKFVMPECLARYVTWPGGVTADPRTQENESIHPTRFTLDYLKAEKERWRATNNYAGQMQQRPAAAEGAIVKLDMWSWFRLATGVRDDIPVGSYDRPKGTREDAPVTIHQKSYYPDQWDFDWITLSVDPAAKKTEKGSQYGLLVIAGKGGQRFVLDDETQRGHFHEILDVIHKLIKKWRPDTLLIEPKAAGPDLMDTLREQMFAGDLPMIAIEEADPGNTDKEMRFQAAMPYIRNGAVHLLDGAAWVNDFIKELAKFPNGDNDDRVDALAQCLNHKRAAQDELPDW